MSWLRVPPAELIMSYRYGLSVEQRRRTRIALRRSFEDGLSFQLDFSGRGERKVIGHVEVSKLYKVCWRLGGELGRLKYHAVSTTIERGTGSLQADHF